jgi:hypothetical protein
MARTHATEPAVYGRSATTDQERSRTTAIAAAALGVLVLLAVLAWWIWGAATT